MRFYKISTPLPSYIPYPRFLLDLPLNETARLVYSLILSRIHLSQSNGWADDNGCVFCRYTITDLMNDTGKSKSTIVTALADLEAQGLLKRHREGTWNANKLYICIPANSTTVEQKTTPQQCGKPDPNKRKSNILTKKEKSFLDYSYLGDSI